MIVRRLTIDDREQLWNLRLRSLQDSPEGFGATYEETIARGYENYVKRLAENQESKYWLGAFDDDQAHTLIGMVGLIREPHLKSQHKALIISMYVIPEARGKDVGKALLSEIINYAKTTDLDQLQLAVVTTNEPARKLYRSLGFEVYGIEPRALKKDGQFWDEELMILQLK